jgi:hypothetical protein
MIPGAYALSSGTLAHPIPLANFQMSEILLTAGQSLLGLMLLAGLRLTGAGAALLFGLFAGQLALPAIIASHPGLLFGLDAAQIHPVFSILYITSAAAVFAQNPGQLRWLIGMSRKAECESGPEPERTPYCSKCTYRLAARKRAAGA